ncbi:MAG: peptidylprolyl isomerase [Bryobacteraceae bacterium]
MKTLFLTMVACGIALAQTKAPAPAPKAAPAATKAAPAATKAVPAATKAAPAAAKKAAPPALNLLDPSTMRAKAPETFRVKFTTTKGDVLIDVTRAWAPLGADRFYNLIRGNFYKDAAFFRVVPRFVAQFGIPARPDVARVWDNAKIVDDKVLQSNKRGTLTFATAGPNTRTTQIFINYSDNAALDAQGFAPFGVVVEGMDLVDKFFAGYGESPNQGLITAQGKAYLDKGFPNLDRILSTTIVPVDAPAAAPAGDAKKQ